MIIYDSFLCSEYFRVPPWSTSIEQAETARAVSPRLIFTARSVAITSDPSLGGSPSNGLHRKVPAIEGDNGSEKQKGTYMRTRVNGNRTPIFTNSCHQGRSGHYSTSWHHWSATTKSTDQKGSVPAPFHIFPEAVVFQTWASWLSGMAFLFTWPAFWSFSSHSTFMRVRPW